MGHLGVVGVGLVQSVGLAFAHVHRERGAVVGLLRIVGLAGVANEILQERVRAGGVVRRVGERQNVFVGPHRESLDPAEFGILQLLPQQAQEMVPPGFIAGKRLAQALHRAGGRGILHVEQAARAFGSRNHLFLKQLRALGLA
ncbi:hypothetical protein MAIT1_04666 [Magnetofaba australis IT-1]|uniref:Uncharacterized protein n=1 Tax=Magnetofaba australis IT-1 TaxID=1434232 RepID=A0A1Y2KAN4_9PROT|nr:hypothetical protein MAIT1_04666 [Magnetofaba australis IT-1]